MSKKQIIISAAAIMFLVISSATVILARHNRDCKTSATYFSTHPNSCPINKVIGL